MLVFGKFFYCNYFQDHLFFFFLEIWVEIKIINGRSITQYVLYIQTKLKMLCFHLHVTNIADFIKKKKRLLWNWRPTISKQARQLIHLSAKQVPTQCGGKRLVSNLTQILTHKLISNSEACQNGFICSPRTLRSSTRSLCTANQTHITTVWRTQRQATWVLLMCVKCSIETPVSLRSSLWFNRIPITVLTWSQKNTPSNLGFFWLHKH